MARAAGEISVGTTPGGPARPLAPGGRASAAAGKAGPGVAAISAAYCAGSTMTTVSCRPCPDVPTATETAADRWTPGTRVISRWAAGMIPGPTSGAVTRASAPVADQDAATSARATAPWAMAANAITVNARTSANAGSRLAWAAARPRAKPTTSTTPRRRRLSVVSQRKPTGYARMISRATGTAASTGAALVNRSTWPGGGRPCCRSRIRPAAAAQTSAESATQRRAVTIRRRAAGLAPAWPARRVRYHHAASAGGPASAAAMIRPASHQASDDAGPGVARTAAPTPAAAAGSTTAAPPASAVVTSCRSDAPRARIIVNSPRRRSATSLAASSTTTAPITASGTNSSDSTRWTASSVATKDGSVLVRPLLRLIWIVADGPAAALRLVPTAVAAGR